MKKQTVFFLFIAFQFFINIAYSSESENEISIADSLVGPDFFKRSEYDRSSDKELSDNFDEIKKIIKNSFKKYDLEEDTALIDTDKLWSQSIDGVRMASNKDLEIPVCWKATAEALSNERGRNLTRKAVELNWERFIKVKFIGWNNICNGNSKGIKIAVYDKHPTSAVGTDANNPSYNKNHNSMILNFKFEKTSDFSFCRVSQKATDDCIYVIAAHEFGHALGINHEQIKLFNKYLKNKFSSQDIKKFDNKCKEIDKRSKGFYKEIKEAEENNFEEVGKQWSSSLDQDSIMNYCNDIYRYGENDEIISELDKFSMRIFYGTKNN